MLLLHLLRNRQERAAVVVKSTNSTVLIDRICQASGMKCVEVPVGFKHICRRCASTTFSSAARRAGHRFPRHIPERDGMLANLILLKCSPPPVSPSRKSHPPSRRNSARARMIESICHFRWRAAAVYRGSRKNPPSGLLGSPLKEVKTSDGVKYIAEDDSWLMFRTSGTEPIIRIYSEASSIAKVKKLLELGKSLARQFAR